MNETCYACGGEMKIFKDKAYHYKESGLSNIIIFGLTQYRCKGCNETYVTIPQVERLHQLIGRDVCCSKGLLEGEEIRFLRKELHMQAKDFAKILSVRPETLSKWENSHNQISPASDKLIRTLYILFISEQTNYVPHKNVLEIISGVPSTKTKKTAREPLQRELNPTQWMGMEHLEFCPV